MIILLNHWLLMEKYVRIFALTTESVQEGQTRHYTWPTASAAMGRTMTATLLMGQC